MRTLRFLLIPLLVVPVLSANRKPLIRKILSSATHSEKTFAETVAKLNRFPEYAFVEAYRNETTHAYYSAKFRMGCWLQSYDEDDLAGRIVTDLTEFKSPAFRYGNWVGYCLDGDTEELARKVRYILIGAGEWRE